MGQLRIHWVEFSIHHKCQLKCLIHYLNLGYHIAQHHIVTKRGKFNKTMETLVVLFNVIVYIIYNLENENYSRNDRQIRLTVPTS